MLGKEPCMTTALWLLLAVCTAGVGLVLGILLGVTLTPKKEEDA